MLNFRVAKQPPVGQGLLNIGASRLHADTPYSVGLLWTSDQPDTENSDNTYKRQTSMTPAGFEPAVPINERPLGSNRL